MNKKLLHSLIGFLLGAVIVFIAVSYYRAEKVSAEYAARPVMPIAISYRLAILGDGMVARFKNRTDRNLAVIATFKNPTLSQEKSFRLDLPANHWREFGYAEGWTFASGDTIHIYHNDYKTLKANAP